MGNTLAPRHFFGSRSVEHKGPGFALALRKAIIPPDHVPEHSHEGAHLVLAIDAGYLSAAINSGDRNGPMSLVYNPPGTLHRDRFTDHHGRFLSIDIDDNLVPDGIVDPFIIERQDSRMNAGQIVGLLSGADPDDLQLEDRLLAMVTMVKEPKQASLYEPSWLPKAREAMLDLACDSGLQIRDIAKAVGVHPVHFARVHRMHMGCSPGAALRQHRLAQAAAYLPSGDDLSQIAYEAGFADQSHMTRAFRRHLGTTPAVFRDAFD